MFLHLKVAAHFLNCQTNWPKSSAERIRQAEEENPLFDKFRAQICRRRTSECGIVNWGQGQGQPNAIVEGEVGSRASDESASGECCKLLPLPWPRHNGCLCRRLRRGSKQALTLARLHLISGTDGQTDTVCVLVLGAGI